MRHLIKALLISAASFYVAYTLVPTISLGKDLQSILIVITGLFVVAQIINPVFSLVLLPINILTFGLVSLALNIALLFAFIQFVPGLKIAPYHFLGANIEGFIIPAANFNATSALILIATIITFSQKILHLIFE